MTFFRWFALAMSFAIMKDSDIVISNQPKSTNNHHLTSQAGYYQQQMKVTFERLLAAMLAQTRILSRSSLKMPSTFFFLHSFIDRKESEDRKVAVSAVKKASQKRSEAILCSRDELTEVKDDANGFMNET
jgi:hypothetical protein